MSKIKNKQLIYEYDNCPEPSYDGKYRELSVPIIKYMTNRVRKTIEYRSLIRYMKLKLDINTCAFYKDYNLKAGFSVELHHAPFTLFDYTYTVCTKQFEKNKGYIVTHEVVDEVLTIHYNFNVGLVPLNPTSHLLADNDRLPIHPTMVTGDWEQFMVDYKDWLYEDIPIKSEEFNKLKDTDPNEVPEILKYKPVMISNKSFISLENLDVKKIMISKMKQRYLSKVSVK